MKDGKYFIVLFCNKKRVKLFYKCQKRPTVYEHWRKYKSHKPPRFPQIQGGKRNKDLVYELALIFPHNRWIKKIYVKDSLGRQIEAKMEDEKLRIKEIIPYWKEELIYDYQIKKRVPYQNILDEISEITEIGQIFTLNNKLFVQVENDVMLFGNKNINDTQRLFKILREDLLEQKKGNFIFVKDVSTVQRKSLYGLLENKGFKRTELFRHYSY